MNELEKLRILIDFTDENILYFIKKRMELVKKVGEYKKANDIPIFQPERRKQLLNDRKKKAEQMGIDSKFVEKVWELFHQYALMLEENI